MTLENIRDLNGIIYIYIIFILIESVLVDMLLYFFYHLNDKKFKVKDIDNEVVLFGYYFGLILKYPITHNFLKQSFKRVDTSVVMAILRGSYCLIIDPPKNFPLNNIYEWLNVMIESHWSNIVELNKEDENNKSILDLVNHLVYEINDIYKMNNEMKRLSGVVKQLLENKAKPSRGISDYLIETLTIE